MTIRFPPALTLNSVITGIFNFNASDQFWYIRLILTLSIFLSCNRRLLRDYKKSYWNLHAHYIFLSILIMYLFILFVPSFWLALTIPLKYLLYFLLGIYTNDNYELICRSFKRISMKEIILLSDLI